MKTVACIPARYASTRFPGKPLALIQGKPMILWVAEGAQQAGLFDQVVVATDDSRIQQVVEQAGFKVAMTDGKHPSGTDRVKEAVQSFNLQDQDVVVNIQGDEPLVNKEWLQALVEPFRCQNDLQLTTLAHAITLEEIQSPNSVKVLTDQNNRALYFSRFPIPFSKEKPTEFKEWNGLYKHMGFYGFRVHALNTFCGAPQGLAEKAESLEQLRALALGMPIHVSVVKGSSLGVDTPQDLEKIEKILRSRS